MGCVALSVAGIADPGISSELLKRPAIPGRSIVFLQFARYKQDDQDDEEQSTGTVVVTAASVKAATEGEDQKNDQDNTESADGECAACELHDSSVSKMRRPCQSFPATIDGFLLALRRAHRHPSAEQPNLPVLNPRNFFTELKRG
jgi:hypothetical protein